MSEPIKIHVAPTNDLWEHDTEGANPCWCCPRVETQEGGGQLITHNSADGRELLEEMDPLLSDRPIGLFLAQVVRAWTLPALPHELRNDRAFQLAWEWLSRRYACYRPAVENGFDIQKVGDRVAADFLELFLPLAEVGDEEG